MSELYTLTIKKEASLKKLGYKYICKWDHQFRKEMSDNLELSKYVKALNVMHDSILTFHFLEADERGNPSLYDQGGADDRICGFHLNVCGHE